MQRCDILNRLEFIKIMSKTKANSLQMFMVDFAIERAYDVRARTIFLNMLHKAYLVRAFATRYNDHSQKLRAAF